MSPFCWRHVKVRGSIFRAVVLGIFLCWALKPAVSQIRKPVATTPSAHHSQSRATGYRFEVVSIRPANDTENWMVGATPDEYQAIGRPLSTTVIEAYFPQGYLFDAKVKSYIRDAPKWLWTKRYDFVGKVAPADLATWQRQGETSHAEAHTSMLQEMLRAALKKRCKLVVHRVPAMIQGYALILAKNDPNRKHLRPSKPDEQVPDNLVQLPLDGLMRPIPRHAEIPALKFFHTSMVSLAAELSTLLYAPVENKTGLMGKYDFSLIHTAMRIPSPAQWNFHWLGLKLVPIKVQIDAIVIDHMQQPSPN